MKKRTIKVITQVVLEIIAPAFIYVALRCMEIFYVFSGVAAGVCSSLFMLYFECFPVFPDGSGKKNKHKKKVLKFAKLCLRIFMVMAISERVIIPMISIEPPQVGNISSDEKSEPESAVSEEDAVKDTASNKEDPSGSQKNTEEEERPEDAAQPRQERNETDNNVSSEYRGETEGNSSEERSAAESVKDHGKDSDEKVKESMSKVPSGITEVKEEQDGETKEAESLKGIIADAIEDTEKLKEEIVNMFSQIKEDLSLSTKEDQKEQVEEPDGSENVVPSESEDKTYAEAEEKQPSESNIMRPSDSGWKAPDKSEDGSEEKQPMDSEGTQPPDSEESGSANLEGMQPSDSEELGSADSEGTQPPDSEESGSANLEGTQPSDSEETFPSDSEDRQPTESGGEALPVHPEPDDDIELPEVRKDCEVPTIEKREGQSARRKQQKTVREDERDGNIDISRMTSIIDEIRYAGEERDFVFTAPVSGRYILAVHGENEYSEYEMSWDIDDQATEGSNLHEVISGETVPVDMTAGESYKIHIGQPSESGNYTLEIGYPEEPEDISVYTNYQDRLQYKEQEIVYSMIPERTGLYRFDIAGLTDDENLHISVYRQDGGEEISSGDKEGLTIHSMQAGEIYRIVISQHQGLCSYELQIGKQKETVELTGYTGAIDMIQYKDQCNCYQFISEETGEHCFVIRDMEKNLAVDMIVLNEAGDQVGESCYTDGGSEETYVNVKKGEIYTILVHGKKETGKYLLDHKMTGRS